MSRPAIRANWCRGCGGGANFGDQLTPLLFGRWGIPVEWARPAEAELFGVGSIVSKIPAGFAGTVWGTGTIRAEVRRDLRGARVLAVRGEGTREACGLPAGVPLGDPGILAGVLADPGFEPPERGGRLLVPHYVDRELAGRWPGVPAVAITASPAELVGRVAAAALVVTSSLHGLILADALGVPHVLDPCGDVIGGLWKFADYASAFGETIRPGVERLTARPAMAARQAEHRRILDGLAGQESP